MKHASAAAHAKRAHFCSCGKIVHGNGARAVHRAYHVNRQDGHTYLIEDAYYRLFPRKDV